jgi:hypothetical protein
MAICVNLARRWARIDHFSMKLMCNEVDTNNHTHYIMVTRAHTRNIDGVSCSTFSASAVDGDEVVADSALQQNTTRQECSIPCIETSACHQIRF